MSKVEKLKQEIEVVRFQSNILSSVEIIELLRKLDIVNDEEYEELRSLLLTTYEKIKIIRKEKFGNDDNG